MNAPGPLNGYRVVELAGGLAGPQCGLQLADAGADVVKLEPTAGDPARGWGSPAQHDSGAVFAGLNRNKRSLALDLSTDEGLSAAQRLIAASDVLIADINRLPSSELTYERLSADNPRLIYLAISGWGSHGPWRDLPGAELSAQLASEVTIHLGRFREPPVRLAVNLASAYTAIYGVQSVCAAILERGLSGLGQRIDLSLFGSLLFARTEKWVALSQQDQWGGFFLESELNPPMHGFRCKDGRIYFALGFSTPEQREALIDALGMSWVRQDSLYRQLVSPTSAPGSSSSAVLQTQLLWEQGFSAFTTEELIPIVERHGTQAARKNDYRTLLQDEQVQHLKMIAELEQPDSGTTPVLTPPWRFSGTPASMRLPVPQLGEHNRQVLTELGLSEQEIAALSRTRDAGRQAALETAG